MAIDNWQTPGTDGWFMQQAWLQLRAKHKRLTRLENYRRGTPKVVMGTEATLTAFYRFQRQCRTNVADLVVQALIERLAVRAIHTAASQDDDGDDKATRMWQASGMDVAQSDIYRMLATFGETYTSTVAPDAPGEWSRIVAEDPRECIVLYDAERRPVAAFKLFHDALHKVDYAILYRPGRKVVAYRQRAARPVVSGLDDSLREPTVTFSAASFTIRPERTDAAPADNTADPLLEDLLWSESYDEQDIPIVQHVAPDGVGVFERHTDLIDQINHIILQGLVIATLQAFKQRALELTEDLPKYDDDGNEIDYNDLFSADPGALWKLPLGAKLWESGQVDLGPVLELAKAALQRFAAVTRTPFSMFSSDSTNQSAEGAQLNREGLVFKAEDYQRIETRALLRAISIGFKFMPDDIRYTEVNGVQVDRADIAGMSLDWLPAERYSLQEKATADASAMSLSRRQKLRVIWGMTPKEVDLTMAQASAELLLFPPAGNQQPANGQPQPAGA